MAGPRIHPSEHFLTTSGRRLHATQMRSVIHRLNTQHTYLQGVNVGAAGFQSVNPTSVAALSKRPASAGACLLNSVQTTSAFNLTRITRQDFDRARPSTAFPASRIMAGERNEGSHSSEDGLRTQTAAVRASLYDGDGFPFGSKRSKPESCKSRSKPPVPKIDPFCCSSDFMRKLTPRQQVASVEGLVKGKPLFPAPTPAQGKRMMTRALSTARPPDELVKPKNAVQEERRKSGRHSNAMASVKYKTVTGKIISAEKIQNNAQRLSMVGTSFR
jgi:hypothetical protein